MDEKEKLDIQPKIVTAFSPVQKTEDTYLMGQQTTMKRDLKQILAEALLEAEIAGPDFYYAYPVKGGKIEGPSIGMMISLMRIWGNLKIDTEVEETQESWIFKVKVKDLESNLEYNTIYRQRKPKKSPGTFDLERWEDMQFQAGQSKALRNALTRVIPRWLQTACLKKSKEAIIGAIEKPERAIKSLLAEFNRFTITKEDLEDLLGLPVTDWSIDEIITLRGILNQIKEGVLKPSEIKGKTVDIEEVKVEELKTEVNEKILKGNNIFNVDEKNGQKKEKKEVK